MSPEEKKAAAEAKASEKAAAAEAKAAEKSDVTRVVFTRKDGSTREFTPDLHGEEFVKVADEFGETNKITIATREDL